MNAPANSDELSSARGNSHIRSVRQFFREPDTYLHTDSRLVTRRTVCGDMLKDVDRTSIADLGCGDGSMSLPLVGPGSHLTLVDISAPMLERAMSHASEESKGRIATVCCSLSDFDSSEKFSLILCLGVLAHVPDVRQALGKISSLLLPGGHCLLHLTDASTVLGRLNFSYYGWRSRSRRADAYSLNRLESAKLITEASSIGLRLIEKRRYSMMFPGLRCLPDRWLLRWERRFLESPLTRFGGEALLLFQRAEAPRA